MMFKNFIALLFFTLLSIIYFDAFAVETEKDIEIRIDSLCQLAWDIKSHNAPLAIEYADEALRLAKSIDNDALICQALFYMGGVLNVAGQANAALNYLEKALEFVDKKTDPLLKARIYNGIGLAKVDIGEYTKALENYNKALEVYKKIDDKEGIALQLQNIGVVYHLTGRTNDALKNYLEAISILEKLDGAESGIIANNYTNTAIVFMSINENDKAIEYYNKAKNIYTENNDLGGLAHVYLNMGVMYFTENLDSALNYHSLAVKKFEEMDSRSKYATSLAYVADVYREKGEFQKAADNYKTAIKILDDEGFVYGQAATLTGLGSLHREQGNFDSAISYITKSLELSKTIGALNLQKIAMRELAQTYYKSEDYKSAYDYLNKHKALSDSLLNEEKIKIIKSLEYSYQAEIQQQEIERLKAEQTAFRTRTRALIVIFVILLASLGIIINKQRTIRIKEKLNAKTQKELADEKLRLTESELKFRKKLLLNYALRVTEKNNLLSEISQKLRNLDKKTDKDVNAIIQSIKMNLLLPGERYELDKMTEQAGTEFFIKIDRINPNLTLTEKKICVFLSFGFNSKDIGGIMNISSKTIDNYRSSIRKKLNIQDEVLLNDFFSEM